MWWCRLVDAWDWFWYYRRGKIRFHIVNCGDTYNAYVSNGRVTIWNCYGSKPEAAKDVALFRLNIAIADGYSEQCRKSQLE
jgi:hypothetical protein